MRADHGLDRRTNYTEKARMQFFRILGFVAKRGTALMAETFTIARKRAMQRILQDLFRAPCIAR
jgi:hypothetical protein